MLILASASPRRRELLSLIEEEFTVCPAKDEEKADITLPPEEYVKSLAKAKAEEVAPLYSNDTVIGADTVVVLDGRILGKPKDEADAKSMLSRLSGRTHIVYTGVSVIRGEKQLCFAEETSVSFYNLSEKEIESYIATGEPMDKAGAYGIQRKGALLVKKIDGDYFNVVGLPIGRLSRILKELD